MSRYAICKRIGLDQAVMSRFMNGRTWLSIGNIEKLAALLDLHVVAGKGKRTKGKRK